MAYGDREPDKGQEGGSCNRTSCQAPDAIWYNHGSMSWYCADCRRDIQFDDFNLRDWEREHKPKCGHDMFETRAMMDCRKNGELSATYGNPHFTWDEIDDLCKEKER